MKETTKNKIKYLNRQLLAIQLLERRAEEKKEELEKWLESNADDISQYVQELRNKSQTEAAKHDYTCNFFIARQMLTDGLPYHYISKITGLTKRQLYPIKAKLNKVDKNEK